MINLQSVLSLAILILIIFATESFQNLEFLESTNQECREEIILKANKEIAKHESRAKLILKSSKNGLAIYSEIEGVPSGVYNLVLVKKSTDSSNNSSISRTHENILEIYVEKNRGRTVIEDKQKSCKDISKFKNNKLLIRKTDENGMPVVFYNISQ